MTVKRAIFRCDASATTGAGHVMRCFALAELLADYGWQCGFASHPESWVLFPAFDERVSGRFSLSDSDSNEPADLIAMWPDGCDLLVIDHHHLDEAFGCALRPWAARIAVIDDLAEQPRHCDMLLNTSPAFSAADYRALVPASCGLLLGARFALLSQRFAEHRAASLRRRDPDKPLERILVSMGGSDPRNLTKRVLSGIARAGIDCQVDVLLGAPSPFTEEVQETARAMNSITTHASTERVAEMMARADIAIGAAGNSAWERCCLGLPSIIVKTAENQAFVAKTLADTGAALVLGSHETVTDEAIADAIETLASDNAGRKRMSDNAAGLCDGRGIERVCLALGDQGTTKEGQPLGLRLAEPEDSMLLYQWQCDRRTRRFARQPKAPSRREHERWLENVLSDPDRLLTIVIHDDEPSAVLRFDSMMDRAHREVSIHVAPDKYGRGIANGALRLARENFPVWVLHAEVLPDNERSHALFQSSGYNRVSERRYVSAPGA
jgi:UDP-2,4-diacetamido-2,4,6-trideoxy-beta-L-altropyranose hydrolase